MKQIYGNLKDFDEMERTQVEMELREEDPSGYGNRPSAGMKNGAQMERTQVQMCKEECDGMVILGTDDKRNIEKTM